MATDLTRLRHLSFLDGSTIRVVELLAALEAAGNHAELARRLAVCVLECLSISARARESISSQPQLDPRNNCGPGRSHYQEWSDRSRSADAQTIDSPFVFLKRVAWSLI